MNLFGCRRLSPTIAVATVRAVVQLVNIKIFTTDDIYVSWFPTFGMKGMKAHLDRLVVTRLHQWVFLDIKVTREDCATETVRLDFLPCGHPPRRTAVLKSVEPFSMPV